MSFPDRETPTLRAYPTTMMESAVGSTARQTTARYIMSHRLAV